jgi:hypothetical protein
LKSQGKNLRRYRVQALARLTSLCSLNPKIDHQKGAAQKAKVETVSASIATIRVLYLITGTNGASLEANRDFSSDYLVPVVLSHTARESAQE